MDFNILFLNIEELSAFLTVLSSLFDSVDGQVFKKCIVDRSI